MRNIAVYFVKFILFALLATGLYGAASVSYTTITGVAPCPTVGFIPACFVVFIGYLFMLIATILMISRRPLNKLFLIGWVPVFLLAFIGSIFEISNGSTCPKSSSGLALCYVSLIFTIIIAMSYLFLAKLKINNG